MFKVAVLFALVACCVAAPAPNPGYLAAPAAYHVGAAPVAVSHGSPVATSYSNTYKVSYGSSGFAGVAPAHTAYAAHAAPLTYAAHPFAYATHPAPVAYTAHAAPLSYAAHNAPLAYTSYVH